MEQHCQEEARQKKVKKRKRKKKTGKRSRKRSGGCDHDRSRRKLFGQNLDCSQIDDVLEEEDEMDWLADDEMEEKKQVWKGCRIVQNCLYHRYR